MINSYMLILGLKVAVPVEAPSAIQACSRQLRTIETDQKLTHYLEGHSLYLIVSLQVMVLKYTRYTILCVNRSPIVNS